METLDFIKIKSKNLGFVHCKLYDLQLSGRYS